MTWEEYRDIYYMILDGLEPESIDNEYDNKVYPVTLLITIGEESEGITFYPVYEVTY